MHQDLRSAATHRRRSHLHPAGHRRQTSVRREACPHAHVLPPVAALCAGGRRPAREIATRELRSECSISRPALALPPPTGTAATSTPAGLAPPSSRAATHTTAAIPAGHASLFLWLLRLLLQHMTTAGNTPDEIGKQPGSKRDKILLARHKTLILACFTRAGRALSRHPGRAWATSRICDDQPGASRVTSPMTDTRG